MNELGIGERRNIVYECIGGCFVINQNIIADRSVPGFAGQGPFPAFLRTVAAIMGGWVWSVS